MTIREYATSRAVSYETVRRQVTAYKKDLKGHTEKQGKTTILDDYAVDFLDKHRQPRSVVLTASDEEVQNELQKLHDKVHQLQEELYQKQVAITDLKDEIIQLTKNHNLAIEDKARAEERLLITEQTSKEKDSKLEQYQQELSEKNLELSKYQKTIFGLYKRID